MKKWILLCICAAMLCGCSGQTYETLGEVDHVSATAPAMGKVALQLPGDASVLTAAGADTVYLCDGYTIALQTFASGDLDATIRSVSGFGAQDLTVMESVCGDHERYDFVWVTAGETGDQVCRAAVLDDGSYHYTLTLMADALSAAEFQESWAQLLHSFCLEP